MKKAHKKVIAALAITAGLAGSATIVRCLPVSALENDATNDRPALSEEKKAEIKEKLAAMSEEERAEWLANHPKKGERKERHEKPANMTDEEWEQKKAERKEKMKAKLDAMSEEERAEWLKNHPKKSTDQTEE